MKNNGREPSGPNPSDRSSQVNLRSLLIALPGRAVSVPRLFFKTGATLTTIPTYAADGRRLRNYPLLQIENLLTSGAVRVDRNRRGEIKAANFLPVSGSAANISAFMGQTYSFHEHLPSGHRAWKHSSLFRGSVRELLDADASERERDEFVRNIFRAVPLSVMAASADVATPAPKPAKVISIDSYRKKRPAVSARPIEFDSERRAA